MSRTKENRRPSAAQTAARTISSAEKGQNIMFCNSCNNSWLWIIIILILLFAGGNGWNGCGCGCDNDNNNGCGCGC